MIRLVVVVHASQEIHQLQDEYFAVSKRMRKAKTVQEKMTLLNEFQRIVKESKDALDEIHKKQASLRR